MENLHKAAAILTGPSTHLDHLGVLSSILAIPLIVDDEATYHCAKEFYPDIDVHSIAGQELDLSKVAGELDFLFHSGKFWHVELSSKLHILYGKAPRFIFCPHGNSDKGHSRKEHVKQDLQLVYGKHMLEHLVQTKEMANIRKTFTTGNYRLLYWQKHKVFYDSIVDKKIGILLNKKKKTILYAPTWQDGESFPSFFSQSLYIASLLTPDYNLIIKPHPLLEKFNKGHAEAILQKLYQTPSVFVIHDFPSIYPLLSICDAYIGDFSSIGYDFLTFNRPMFFLQGDTPWQEKSSLHPCGQCFTQASLPFLAEAVGNSFQASTCNTAQKQAYYHAFGDVYPLAALAKDLWDALEKEKGP